MASTKRMAVAAAFMLASVVVNANQCSSGGECPSDDEPQNAVSLLQTRFYMNVLEPSREAMSAAIKNAANKLDGAAAALKAAVGKAAPEKVAAEKAAPEKNAADKAAPEKDAAEEAPSSPFFWRMSWAQLKTVSWSALVYVMGALFVAVIFDQVREKHFGPEPIPESASLGDDLSELMNFEDGFKFPLFGCFSDMKLCLLGCCCPCLAWANTLDQRKVLSYWPAFCVFLGLLVLDMYTLISASLLLIGVGVYYRQKLRESHSADCCSLIMDILSWTCCQPCAIVQEAREAAIEEKQTITGEQ